VEELCPVESVEEITVTGCDYERGFDSWLDLLTTYTYTARDYILQFTVSHRLVSLVNYILH
jgi:hypothetical protein